MGFEKAILEVRLFLKNSVLYLIHWKLVRKSVDSVFENFLKEPLGIFVA